MSRNTLKHKSGTVRKRENAVVKYHKFKLFPNATNVKTSHLVGGKKSTLVLGYLLTRIDEQIDYSMATGSSAAVVVQSATDFT